MIKARHSEFKPLTELIYYSGLPISDYMANAVFFIVYYEEPQL